MKQMLSKQLQEQIEQEAASDASSYGYEPGHEIDDDLQSVYRYAAGKYAALYETAIARAEKAERALEAILNTNHDNYEKVILKVKQIATQALNPKTGSDE